MRDMTDYEIRQVLAELYDSHEKANLAARDIDLQLGRIAYSPAMETYWGNIWIEANFQHKELELIGRVQRDYPHNERIAQIHAHITHMRTITLRSWTLPNFDQESSSTTIIKRPQKKRWRRIVLPILIVLAILNCWR